MNILNLNPAIRMKTLEQVKSFTIKEKGYTKKTEEFLFFGEGNLNVYKINGRVLVYRGVAKDSTEAAEYQGRKVQLDKPFRTPDGPKKMSVYVKNEKGNVVKVNFGDPDMEIKRDNPARRKSFRARHNCDNPGPKWKARYWSCKNWK